MSVPSMEKTDFSVHIPFALDLGLVLTKPLRRPQTAGQEEGERLTLLYT